MKTRQDEIKGAHALLAGELMMKVQDGMRMELGLLHKSMEQHAAVLLRDPDNESAKQQHEMFELKFENRMRELELLERNAHPSTAKISGCKRSLLFDLTTAESDSESSCKTPPKKVSPK